MALNVRGRRARTRTEATAATWPAMTTTLMPLDGLRANPRNPRKHSQEQVEELAKSLLKFGWCIAVLIDGAGVLIAGHGRVEAAALLVERGHLQFRDVPVCRAEGWSRAQIEAYMVLDNKLAGMSEWDDQMLSNILSDLEGTEFQNVGDLFADDMEALMGAGAAAGAEVTEDEVGETVGYTAGEGGAMSGTRRPAIMFGEIRASCSDADLARFRAHWQAYSERMGSNVGFVAFVLDAMDNADA